MLVYHKSLLLVIVPFVTQFLFLAVLFWAFKSGDSMIEEQDQRTRVAQATRMLVSRAHKDFAKNCETFVGDEHVSKPPNPEEASRLLGEVRDLLGTENQKETESLDREWQLTQAFTREVARFLARENLSKKEKRGLFCLAELRLNALARACHSVNAVMEKRVSLYDRITLKHRISSVLVPGVSISVLVALILAVFLNNDLGRSIKRLSDNCRRIGEGEELLPPMSGKDELAELDRTLHQTARVLRGSLAREKAVLDNATNAILTLDTNHLIVSSNPAWERQFGYLSAHAGNNLLAMIDSEDVEILRKSLDSLQLRESQSMTLEMPLVDSELNRTDLIWSLSWDSKRRLYYCVVHDVTEQKEVDARRQEFVAMLTHDLRSPLTSVGVAIELCLSGGKSLSPELADSLKSEKESVRNVVTKINSLLDLERLESGHIDLDCVSVDINFLIDELIQKMQRGDIKIEKNVSTNQSLYADPDRIWEVLSSILRNAVTHSPPGGRVVLSARGDGEWVEVSVKDEGPGIEEDLLSEIFDRYKTLSTADVNEMQSGLGLLLTKAIVDAHGGEIGIESSSNDGTRVSIRLKQYSPPPEARQ
ncbi:MAG: PAS domain S-box protein [Candidatus Obscuribacterales bacterium]|nr:PAS domain S-box protein [Candidatus Obscuribacterales bacterium]